MAPKFKVKVATPAWLKMMREKERPVAAAAVAALRETANNAVEEGRRDIASAGAGFRRAKWQSGLQDKIKGATKDGYPSMDATALIFHKYGIAGIFEHGATIQGRPLLWIPLKHGGASPVALQRLGKKLTYAKINGTPMLFDAQDRDRHRKPLYIGTPKVRIPKKFHVTEIVKEHVRRIAELFAKHFVGN